MRRRLVTFALAFALVCAPSAGAATVFLVRGGGWGHGIGMSQWGAYGQAVAGRTYDQILPFYYQGTTLGAAPSSREVAVLLASGRTSLTIGSGANFTVTGAGGGTYTLAAGDHVIGPGLKITTASGRHVTLTSPVRFHPGSRLLRLNGSYYRGEFGVASTGSALSCVNHLGIEDYVRGVVSRESPSSWPLEALKAQAVAARSYAWVSIGQKAYLYPDTRDQVYGGWGAETPSTNTAVADTAGKYVLYNGSVVQTFFFSSSGGRTCSLHDCWGSSDLPYFVSVDDSAYDKYSPYYRWGSFRYTQAGIAKRVTVPNAFNDIVVTRNGSGRAADVALVGSTTRHVSGGAFQSAFGLRSTRFWVGVLRLRITGHKADGSTVLGGFERFERSGLVVQQYVSGGSWQTVSQLNPASDGTFAVVVKPAVTTWYRVA